MTAIMMTILANFAGMIARDTLLSNLDFGYDLPL